MSTKLSTQEIEDMLNKTKPTIPWFCDTRYGYLLCQGEEDLFDSDGRKVSSVPELELHPFSKDDLILSSYTPDFAKEVVYWRTSMEKSIEHYKNRMSQLDKGTVEYQSAKEVLSVFQELLDKVPDYLGGVVA